MFFGCLFVIGEPAIRRAATLMLVHPSVITQEIIQLEAHSTSTHNQPDLIAVSPKKGNVLYETNTKSFFQISQTDLVLRMEVDVSPNQVETQGSINYILIGDVGQTKEDELYKYCRKSKLTIQNICIFFSVQRTHIKWIHSGRVRDSCG